ncbi:MAG: zinc-ribbon domain-containing protein, partial [Eggerthellaceae bacterium]|nr:zinc-ribbon domain-containing protein [Eggerthellaceae bacterium]
MNCPSCNAEIRDDASFCPACGSAVAENAPAQAPQTDQPSAQPVPQQPEQPPMAPQPYDQQASDLQPYAPQTNGVQPFQQPYGQQPLQQPYQQPYGQQPGGVQPFQQPYDQQQYQQQQPYGQAPAASQKVYANTTGTSRALAMCVYWGLLPLIFAYVVGDKDSDIFLRTHLNNGLVILIGGFISGLLMFLIIGFVGLIFLMVMSIMGT